MQPAYDYTLLSLFTGAGGLDLGFESEGFNLLEAVEIDKHCAATLKRNRPEWNVQNIDIKRYVPGALSPDVITAGFPCQGFSLGGNRDIADKRNLLYKEVLRVASIARPRIIVLENVLNLRAMQYYNEGVNAAEKITQEISALGYKVVCDVFKVAHYDVPQTRRRFIFICFKESPPENYHLPMPGSVTSIRDFLYDLAHDESIKLPNHDINWGFKSAVHVETGERTSGTDAIVPVRFSRTASDGHPIRSFDEPFPAIDTATVWGWAKGDVKAERKMKDRANGKFIRNPNASVMLWRIEASHLRTFTAREYARLQTFPDNWVFGGDNKRDIHKQIGNAVPVNFAKHIARNVRLALEAQDSDSCFYDDEAREVPLQLAL
jgi:DNA (cytosine-5)-methyltransferase 1